MVLCHRFTQVNYLINYLKYFNFFNINSEPTIRVKKTKFFGRHINMLTHYNLINMCKVILQSLSSLKTKCIRKYFY